MSTDKKLGKVFAPILGGMAVVIIVAAITNLWVLTAIPIGILFGFFLVKGDLCGASAFSEVLVAKDPRKLWGLWVCIVTGMVTFAVLDQLGWVKLNPKPLLWASYLVGGAIFGVGTVLAGGCVSGCLFKTGKGHLTTMAALPGIALGVAAVEHGPLHSLYKYLKSQVIASQDGGSVTISSLTGLPFWTIALILAVATVAVAILRARKMRSAAASAAATGNEHGNRLANHLFRSWAPWKAGLAIGLLGGCAYLSSAASGRNYPLGVTHGVLHAQLLVTDSDLNFVWKKKMPQRESTQAKSLQGVPETTRVATTPPVRKNVSLWLVALVASLVMGAWFAARLVSEARLYPKPPEQIVIAFFGGLLVGSGAAIAQGCVVGNIMSGWALMSVGTVLFGIVAILFNWLATYFYLMGAPEIRSKQ